MRMDMRLILQKVGFFLVVVLVALAPVIAHTQNTSPGQTPPAKFVQDLGDKAIRIIADKNLSQQQRSQKYSELLHDAFDLPTIGKFVLGRAWNRATPAQQQEYMKLFEANVIKIYGDRLSFYSGESFHVRSVRQETDNDVVVTSEIDHPGGQAPTTVDWRVRREVGKFAIVDVVIEGVSQSVTERQEYASILGRNNGNFDALLDLMRQRAEKDQNQPGTQQNPQQNPQ
jgi:phospholipid transport system substrate-binding protein